MRHHLFEGNNMVKVATTEATSRVLCEPQKIVWSGQKECGMIQRRLPCAMDPMKVVMMVFQTKGAANLERGEEKVN